MSDKNHISFANRDSITGVNPVFVERWSPRAFVPGPIDEATLTRLFDAARWAPSCFNEQPWRFYTSTADTFDKYLALLVERNQVWAKDASVIGVLVGKTRFAKSDASNDSYALDCGAAWMALALQARFEGLYTHGMAGIKKLEVAASLDLDPEREAVLMGFAIGRLGDKSKLDESLRERESPSPRKPLASIWNP